MTKIAILQNTIYNYRRDFYEKISQNEGIEVTVFHSDESLNLIGISFSTAYLPEKQFKGFYWHPNLQKQLEAFDVVIIMFNVRYLSYMSLLFAKAFRADKKLLLWGHGFGKNARINRLRVWLADRADGLLLYYKEAIEDFAGAKSLTNRVFAINNTIGVSNAGRSTAASRSRFIFVGRLQKRKKIGAIIAAFRALQEKSPDLTLDVVGDGEIREQLQAAAQGLENIVFHGKVTDESALKKLFDESIAYVSPGAIGLGVLHAFAYGCPVITVRHDPLHGPEFNNLIHNENAIIVEDQSVDSLRNAMLALANDEKKQTNLSKAAYSFYAEHRTLDVMSEKMLAAVNSVNDLK